MKIKDAFPFAFLRSGIGRNFVALSFWQATNYLAPLIVMPYLIRVIGMEKFGVISLIQAVNYYFIILVDYGFSITAVRDISVSRSDKTQLSILFSRTLYTKLLICFFSFLCLFVVVALVPRFDEYRMSYLSGFFLVIGQALFPIWFFQGIEEMKYTTYLNVLSKVLYVIGIFVFIQAPPVFSWVLPIQGISLMIAGIVGIYIIRKKFQVSLMPPGLDAITTEIRKGWPVFVSNISVTFYNSSLYLIIGFSVSESLLGVYSVAEKLSQVLRQVVTVFAQAMYPQVCLLAAQGQDQVRAFWRKTVFPFAILFFLICLGVSILSPYITWLFTGKADEMTIELLRWLIWVPLIVFFNIPFFQTLLAYHHNKEVMRSLVACSLISVLTGFILVGEYSIFGAAITLIFTEILIVVTLAIVCERKSGLSILLR